MKTVKWNIEVWECEIIVEIISNCWFKFKILIFQLNVSNNSNKRRFNKKHHRTIQKLSKSKTIMQNFRLQIMKNIVALKRKNRMLNSQNFVLKNYDLLKIEIIVDTFDNDETIMKNILMQFESQKFLAKKSKVKKITVKIIVKIAISTLKLLQLYEKQQKVDNIEVIRQLQLYKREMKRKKLFNGQQIKLNR